MPEIPNPPNQNIPPPIPPPPTNRSTLLLIAFGLINLATIATVVGIVYWMTNTSKSTGITVENPITPTPQPPRLKAEVQYLSGSAWKLVNGRKTVIKEGDIVSQTDQIITDQKSRLVLLFDDGSIVRLNENTHIILTDLLPEKINLDNYLGTIFARVQKDDRHQFIVQAGNITIESTGTAFVVEKQDEVKVLVYENSVQITEPDTNPIAVKTNEQWTESQKTPKKIDTKKLASKEFIDWSLKSDNLNPTSTPPILPTKAPTTSGISLTGKATDLGIKLEWNTSGIDAPNGFKVVKSSIANPVYPGSEFAYLSDPSTRSYTWPVKDGQKWHFRVCRYIEGTCTLYSNNIEIIAHTGTGSDSTKVSGISLSVSKNGQEKAVLEWSVTGTSDLGFKIVWSENSNPTYPTRDGDQFHYLSDPNARRDEISGLNSGKTYYFRVCEYLGGSCGLYSDQKSLTF